MANKIGITKLEFNQLLEMEGDSGDFVPNLVKAYDIKLKGTISNTTVIEITSNVWYDKLL